MGLWEKCAIRAVRKGRCRSCRATLTSSVLIPNCGIPSPLSGIFPFSALSVVLISTAHWTAFTTLANSARTLSPAELTKRP